MWRFIRIKARAILEFLPFAVIFAGIAFWLDWEEKHPDRPKQFRKLKSMADKGDADAEMKVAGYYFHGWLEAGVTNNPREAAHYYMKAAQQHQGNAVEWVSFAYAEGSFESGIERNVEKAIPYLYEAVRLGSIPSMIELGKLLKNGGNGIKADLVESTINFKKAADLNAQEGQFFYAEACRLGIGVTRDYCEAYAWYNLAAANHRTLDEVFAWRNLESSDHREHGVIGRFKVYHPGSNQNVPPLTGGS